MKNIMEFTVDDIFGDSLNLKLEDEREVDLSEPEIKKEVDKLVKVTEKGIVILDEDLMNEVKKKNLSASMVSSFFQCPADWLMDSFILPKIEHEEPIYFERGHIFHETMEKFFALPKDERNPQVLSQLAGVVVKEDYPHVMNNPETLKWVREALVGYLETGFNYKDVEIAQIPKRKNAPLEPGLELFVRGKLGNTKRQVVGFVDRVDQLPDGSLQIVDYKTGKKIHPFDPNKPISQSNDFGYWRQQLAYTMLLEQDGFNIGGAKLEFPIAKGEVVIDVNNQELRNQVIKDFEAVAQALTKAIEENFFPFHGHFFCSWCGLLSPNHKPNKWSKLNLNEAELAELVEFL